MNFTILVEGFMFFLIYVFSLYLDCMLDVYVGIEMKIIKKMECFYCMVTIIKLVESSVLDRKFVDVMSKKKYFKYIKL